MSTGDENSDELIKYMEDECEFFDHGFHFYPQIKCLMPVKYLDSEKRIRDLTVYEDDVWVLTYPKCGTTWTQEMVWMIGHDLDYKGAEVDLYSRCPFMEFSALFAGNKEISEIVDDTVATVEQMPRPRYIKSHLPLELLPSQLAEKKPKIVYVMRNPKDAAVSFYYHYKLIHNYQGTMDTYFEAFIRACVYYGCFFHHVAAFWNLRHESNVCFLTYEDMKKDLPSVIRRTATFLGKSLTDEQVATLAEHLSFAKMKDNSAVNLHALTEMLRSLHKKSNSGGGKVDFIRKGEVGDYKNKMSPEMVEKFDKWIIEMKQLLGLDKDKEFPY